MVMEISSLNLYADLQLNSPTHVSMIDGILVLEEVAPSSKILEISSTFNSFPKIGQ